MSDLQLPTLAEFVRGRRALPTESAPSGMSRQHLATAIHSSVGYIAKIEQGDARSPSAGVLDALSNVFGLDHDERAHLFRLAGQSVPNPETATEPTVLQPTLDALAPHPAAAVDHCGNILAANDAFDRAFPEARASGNTVHWLFTNPFARLVVEEWEREASLAVAQLRHYAADIRDPEPLRRLIDGLSSRPDFRRLWTAERVAARRPNPTMRLRDARTGTVYTIRIEEFVATGHGGAPRMLIGLLPGSNTTESQ
ncbi:helix-turn-helix domain-containing protein [Nocardia mexicana]|uniref:Helix-turn-helix protein n=1 Tax=Nocardia mexicana TaxID=279262 RepID=A0A370GJ60_9NOCA|nr:helix-turn-helix domain-containing protein [Nocardia mexicana]RDI43259.1 helix-turn-helix protein [Nocardia mexicana]